MAVFGPDGREDMAALGTRADSRSAALANLPAGDEEDAHALVAALEQHRIDLANAPTLRLFGGDTCPGDQESFTAERDVVCFVTAPGKPMRVDEQDPPTDLRIIVKRAQMTKGPASVLPPPLAPGAARSSR